MDAYQTHALSTSAWLSLQAIPLFLSPRLIVNMLATEPRSATDLETYLSRTHALSLFTLSLLPLIFTGILLPHSSAEEAQAGRRYAAASTWITTSYHISSLVYCYLNWNSNGVAGFVFGALGSGVLAAWGLGVLIFAGGDDVPNARGKVSGWPFRNAVEREEKREKMARKKGL